MLSERCRKCKGYIFRQVAGEVIGIKRLYCDTEKYKEMEKEEANND